MNKKAKVHIIIGLFLLFFYQKAIGQDIVFAHPYAAMLYNNPAYTGIFGHLHAGSTFRSQFSASVAPYTTYYAEADVFIDRWKSGFGFYVLNDLVATGQLRRTSVAVSYVFDLQISDNLSLRPAIQAVYHNRHRDFQSLVFPDLIDITGSSIPTTSLPYEPYNLNSIDFSVGLLSQYRNFEFGVAAHHIGDNKEQEYLSNPLKINLQTKLIIPIGDGSKDDVAPTDWLALTNVKLIPSLRYIYQEHYNYVVAALFLQSGTLFTGVGMKTALNQDVKNISLSVGFLSSTFRMGYTTDFIGWGGVLGGWQGVSHEVFVHFIFGENNHNNHIIRGKQRKKNRSDSCFGCYL
jgi:type IX secretion system PorP/SprF family membrane protein